MNTKPTLEQTAMNVSAEYAQYPHDHCRIFTEQNMQDAANSGKIEFLKYAHNNGVVFKDNVIVSAIRGNCFEALEFVHEHGAPITDKVYNAMFERLHIKIWEYVFRHSVSHPITKKCQYCALLKKRWIDIDWTDDNILRHPDFQKTLKSRRIIYEAMERAYIDPKYAWCIRRLRRDFDNLTLWQMSIQTSD